MDDGYVGRYGDTLRRITQQQAQAGAFAAPAMVGGADQPGITPVRMGQTRSTRDMLGDDRPQQAPQEKEGGMGGMDPSAMMGMFGGGGDGGSMMSGGAGFTGGSGGGMGVEGAMSGGGMMMAADGGFLDDGATLVGERGPELVQKQGNRAFVVPTDQLGPQAAQGAFGAISEAGAMGQEKPTSWKDLAAEMPKSQQNALVKQIEETQGPIKSVYAATVTRQGEEPKAKNKREMALYIAEVALRTISNMGTGRYSGPMGSAAAFTDAMLDTETRRGRVSQYQQEKAEKAAETRRLEDRADAETRRKENREDAKDKTKREQDLEDDDRNHKQAIELVRIQTRLLRENGKRTWLQVQEDGTLALIDEDGNAVDVAKEVEETTPVRGSRGQGTTGGQTRKVRKPVKVRPKSDSSGLDKDTVLSKITQVENELRKDKKLMRELRTKFEQDGAKVEAELRRMAREKVHGDVQSLGSGASDSGVINFNDL
jgi:hypothetical protein